MKDKKMVDATIDQHGRTLILEYADCAESLRGTGILMVKNYYAVASGDYIGLSPKILYLPGTKPGDNYDAEVYDTEADATEAREAFESLLNEINAEHAEPEPLTMPETYKEYGQRFRIVETEHDSDGDLYYEDLNGDILFFSGAVKKSNFAGYYYQWLDSEGIIRHKIVASPVLYLAPKRQSSSLTLSSNYRIPLRPVGVAFLEEES